ncbi:replication initiation protein [Burkholderia ubonensis]|uniref:replication initiation protein n=1 Tax=Burkholderia ubonensis TaxID=101571 RepID=UPI00210CDF68|nr:replication initiation protein [Burkholderia ubonensis]
MATKKETGREPMQIALFQMPEMPDPFRKAVPAIHIAPKTGPISLQQAKTWNALIKNAIEQRKEGERTWFEYSIGDLISDVGLNSKNREYVKATINSLLGFVVNWDQLAAKSEWNASALLAGAKISGGTLKYQFSDNISELLLSPEVYASIDMRIARTFKRGYALTLWENVVRYEGVGQTGKMKVNTLRDLLLGMDWAQGSYAEYKIFKSRILVPALREINDVSDHEIVMKEEKTGRSVTEVRFFITPKRKSEATSEEDLDVLTAMTKLSVPLSEARKLLGQHGPEAVRQALAYTDVRVKKKNAQPLDNVASYFRKALANGYQLENGRGKPDSSVVSIASSPEQAEDKLLSKLLAERAEQARGYFNELDSGEQADCVSRYNESQMASQLKLVANNKPKKAAEQAFFHWLAEDVWGKPTDRDLLNFVLAGGGANFR